MLCWYLAAPVRSLVVPAVVLIPLILRGDVTGVVGDAGASSIEACNVNTDSLQVWYCE